MCRRLCTATSSALYIYTAQILPLEMAGVRRPFDTAAPAFPADHAAAPSQPLLCGSGHCDTSPVLIL